MVPGKGQFLGESAYFFIRNSVARDMIGHDFRKYVPLLIALFSFVLVNNLWGVFPLSLLPTTSHVGWAYGLAGLVWVLYNGVGIRQVRPPGLPQARDPPSGCPEGDVAVVIPLEFFSNIIVRPHHAVLATVRQHVRRAPADPGLRAGRGVPADPQ